MSIPFSETSNGATLPRGGFSSRRITDLCQMDYKTTLPHSLQASPLLLTHTFEMHREGCHASHLLAFQMPQIKENMND